MSWMDHDSETRNCGAEVAAYVLGALDRDEAEAFRNHLESCAVCRDELAAFCEVVDLLPMSAPQHQAPAGLRRRVLEAVAREPKLGTRGAPERRPHSLWARLPVARPVLALGAAVALIAIAVAGAVLGSTSSTSTHVYAAQVTGQGKAKLTVTGGHAELIVRDFSPPPAGEIYEVWLARPGRAPAPTKGLFSVTARGDADVQVPGSLQGVKLVMVTPEPAGGTSKPTHPAVIRAELS